MLEHDSESELDSDEELQEAFAKGLLKPGLNITSEVQDKQHKNDVVGMKQALASIAQSLSWVERLELTNDPAPEAPELSQKLEEKKEKAAKQSLNSKVDADDPAVNDFKREMMFHRQAQAAVVEGIVRLKNLGILTKRPDDYFAQMAKSDDHMQKVRERLLKSQRDMEHREKVRHIRLMRKTNKQLQAQIRLQREKEKREVMNKVKEFRDKKRPNLDFLDEKRPGKPKAQGSTGASGPKRGETKTKFKNQKYGMGGKKRGSKRNTKESTHGFAVPGKSRGKGKGPSQAKGKGALKNKAVQRPGKSKRMKQKSKRR